MHFFVVLETDLLQLSVNEPWNEMLFDHCPLKLNKDDYARVCLIPKKKVSFILYA